MHSNPEHGEDEYIPLSLNSKSRVLVWKRNADNVGDILSFLHKPELSMPDNQSSDPQVQLHNNSTINTDSDDNYYDELYPPTTTRWSDFPRNQIPGLRLRIPPVPRGLTPQEEWNYVFTMIARVARDH
ncbi:hypothetical protein KSP39_PZI014967 [Platanthera zijinensis]|uniref:Uncharacterized protein n=1 Tax=Platanthera zijinensis TaxID=2320716 RepID=A0AAP0G2R4_9ASPA